MNTELELIIDLHRNSERQGPGSVRDTLRALDFIPSSPSETLKVADLGCGSGGQTITLAQHLNAHITALDLFPEFLDELREKSRNLGLEDVITPLQGSMEELPFQPESLDLIWSEGAIYNMGFENGIRQWGRYLKPGGHLAVSELTWIAHARPPELESFWLKEYPEVDIASGKISILENNGYTLVGYFYLSPDSWIEHYFKPMQDRFEDFLRRHRHSELAQAVVQANQAEIELYQKFKDYFSYGFYIARKNS